ncbi:Dipeptidyl-peptidase 7 [termite gut metagenome]|uniref:Dipeptidyl-peptidase 7 n=1 Tax=termite gut metagenome TaxID=433724 RepID=A0A5J4SWA3_9ZZZZ
MKKLNIICLFIFLVIGMVVRADEGMWMPGNLNKHTRKTMKELGLQIPASQLYNPDKPSLKDAIVSFGGFCSGVVVSTNGLVFTNHHCGFNTIQQHSSLENDYITNGFTVHKPEEELPCLELYVRFLLKTEDVTQYVLKTVRPDMTEKERKIAIDSVTYAIQEKVSEKDSTLTGIVDAYYGGNEFWLSIYQDFNDVRLVFAPPASIGKFGWDTDNWIWPRHAGDFCLFRIYADKQNRPANYHPDNVPYHPSYVAPISLKGYEEGSFCMTLGYPGNTERDLSSFGIEEIITNKNQAIIDVRSIKQTIWKREMGKNPDIRFKYASKYAESSNYWKNSIGMNNAIHKQKILEKKRKKEAELLRYIQKSNTETANLHLFSSLETNYKNRREVNKAQAYFLETFFNSSELLQFALELLNLDLKAEKDFLTLKIKKIVNKYANFNIDIDKEVFIAILNEYRSKVDTVFLPEIYHSIAQDFGGNIQAFADSLYSRTRIITPYGLKQHLEKNPAYSLYDDPAISIAIDLMVKYYEMNQMCSEYSADIDRDERELKALINRMYADCNRYPDANSTMRLSFGTVSGYSPFDGVKYTYSTTVNGILEKTRMYENDPDFAVEPELITLFASEDYGRYADSDGGMKVCFISNNDITGGSSGSAMFNGKGELIGLAFDGNWEAMDSDFIFDPSVQRCIGLDIRYLLFIIEKYKKAMYLIEELKLNI